MLSFVEQPSDIEDVQEILLAHKGRDATKQAHYILKIESRPGLAYLRHLDVLPPHQHLMAARDDLLLNIGDNKAEILRALQEIADKDDHAICASQLFPSLEHGDIVSVSDLADLYLMRQMGYHRFMLSDEICRHRFDAAITAWEGFIEAFPLPSDSIP